ncbi:MAG TPA: hypothetical protein VGK56_04665, partial [Anaerolineales bacterium]
VMIATGCGVPPPVPVPAAPPCELPRGGSTVLTATGAQGATSLEWSASAGQVTPNQGPAVTFTAPTDYSGSVIITVIARKGSAQSQGQMTCTILPPPPTPTPEPTATLPPTPTEPPTATPEPIACNFPPLTADVFPGLAEVEGQYPIYGPVEGADAEHILCEGVTDIVHDGALAVHYRYTRVDKNAGWFGIATPNGYDASQHDQLCFWAYARQPRQTFRVKMKDTSLNEAGVVTTISKVNEWEEICTDISEFAALGINVEQMDNVNLGFEDPLGSAEIWIADFTFR